MISAFGIEHGELSKAFNPIAKPLAALGGRAARKGGSAMMAHGGGAEQRGASMAGKSTGFGDLLSHQATAIRGGKTTKALGKKSKNFRQGYQQQVARSYQSGRASTAPPLPSFLR